MECAKVCNYIKPDLGHFVNIFYQFYQLLLNRLELVRILKGIPQPTALCPVDNHGAAVLCRREIKIIDLNQGGLRVSVNN